MAASPSARGMRDQDAQTRVVTVTLDYTRPAGAPAGSTAMAFYYDSANGRVTPLTPLDSDGTHIRALATHFSAIFGAIVDMAKLPAIVDSSFRPGVDDWQFPNYGSYVAARGHCEGQSLSAIWYYNQQRRAGGASALYGLYDNNGASEKTPAFWYDDSQGYRFASSVQASAKADLFSYNFFRNLGFATSRIAHNRRTRESLKEIREAVSDRGRTVRSRGERPPNAGSTNHRR